MTQSILDNPQAFGDNILWTDQSKVKLCGSHESFYIWCKANTEFYNKNTIGSVKHGAWSCDGVGTLNGSAKTKLRFRVGKEPKSDAVKGH